MGGKGETEARRGCPTRALHTPGLMFPDVYWKAAGRKRAQMNERLQETARMRRRSPGEGARAESSARKQAPAARKSLISSAPPPAARPRPHPTAPGVPAEHGHGSPKCPRHSGMRSSRWHRHPPGLLRGASGIAQCPPLAPTGTPTALHVPVTITPIKTMMVPAGPWGHRGWPGRGRWRRHRNRIPGARYLPRWCSSMSAAPLLFHLPLGFGEGEVSQMPTKSWGRFWGGRASTPGLAQAPRWAYTELFPSPDPKGPESSRG